MRNFAMEIFKENIPFSKGPILNLLKVLMYDGILSTLRWSYNSPFRITTTDIVCLQTRKKKIMNLFFFVVSGCVHYQI